MAKRVSRKELKEKIRELQRDLRCAALDNIDINRELGILKHRFAELGSRTKTIDLSEKAIDTKAEQWGTYIAFCNRPGFPNEEELEKMKGQLATNIANGLIERNLIQYILHDTAIDHSTLGAKIYVIPWDKMAVPSYESEEEW